MAQTIHLKIPSFLVNTAQYILPKLLGPYSNEHPHVELPLEIGNRSAVLARFERGEDDIYVFLEFLPTIIPLSSSDHVANLNTLKPRAINTWKRLNNNTLFIPTLL